MLPSVTHFCLEYWRLNLGVKNKQTQCLDFYTKTTAQICFQWGSGDLHLWRFLSSKHRIFYLNTHCWISSFLCLFNHSVKICLEMPSTKREQNKFDLTHTKRKLKEFDKNLINKKIIFNEMESWTYFLNLNTMWRQTSLYENINMTRTSINK